MQKHHPSTPLQWAGAITAGICIAAMLAVGALNAAMGCDRNNPDNCIVVQHVWQLTQ